MYSLLTFLYTDGKCTLEGPRHSEEFNLNRSGTADLSNIKQCSQYKCNIIYPKCIYPKWSKSLRTLSLAEMTDDLLD